MLQEKNVIQRLNSNIKEKNSVICAELNLADESIPKSFKESFTFGETMSDEIIYEYAVAYLQSIADIVPAVIIKKKEGMEKLYWRIVELAKVLGFFVISEVDEEDISYILENKTKLIIENHMLDAVIILVDLDNVTNNMQQFLKLLKENGKAVFINAKNNNNSKKKLGIIERIQRKKRPSNSQLFFELQHKIEPISYNEHGEPMYSMVGLAIMQEEHFQMANTYGVTLVYNYEENQINDIINLIDGDGLGSLIVMNLRYAYEKDCWKDQYSEENWAEVARKEAIQQNEKINKAVNEFYGIEND